MPFVRITVVLAGVIATSPLMCAAARAQERQFDVVSVKKHVEIETPPLFDLRGVPGGRVRIRAMSLFDIIQFVYPEYSRDHQIEGEDSGKLLFDSNLGRGRRRSS